MKRNLLQRALIFLPLAILLALTIESEVIDDKAIAHFLLLLTVLVGILFAVRYLLTTYKHELLLQERERRLQEAEQLYQQLQAAHQYLRELDQLKDQFLMTASHELRTPLTSVQGYLALMSQFHDQLPPEKHREYLQKAQQSCEVLVMLLSNVMDASRLDIESGIQPAHFERVSVKEVLQSVIDLIEPQLTQEKRELYLNIPAHLFVRADPGRLRQVLLNLSNNALKYSQPGTPIAFSAHAITDAGPAVVIRVIDKGNGIPPKDQPRLFQRFVRLERDMNSVLRGSGLGLYISRRLIEAMNGKIGVESSGIEGAGSTFFFQLPMQ